MGTSEGREEIKEEGRDEPGRCSGHVRDLPRRLLRLKRRGSRPRRVAGWRSRCGGCDQLQRTRTKGGELELSFVRFARRFVSSSFQEIKVAYKVPNQPRNPQRTDPATAAEADSLILDSQGES